MVLESEIAKAAANAGERSRQQWKRPGTIWEAIDGGGDDDGRKWNDPKILTTMIPNNHQSSSQSMTNSASKQRRDYLGLSIAIVLRWLQFVRFIVYRDGGRVRRIARRRVDGWLGLFGELRYGYSASFSIGRQLLVRIIGAIFHDHLVVLRRSRLVLQDVDGRTDWLLLVLLAGRQVEREIVINNHN